MATPPPPAAPTTVHSYTFVPSAAGASDLGGYFRLGGYSEVEANAADITPFYPRLHGTDVAASVGGAQGIVLTCTGRMLIRAGEAFYVQSVGAMSIDTVSTLAVNADSTITVTSGDEIFITSGAGKNITIEAGGSGTTTADTASATPSTPSTSSTGTVSISAQTENVTIFGESTEKVTKDKYEYFQANHYKIMMGTQNYITLGGKFTIWVGASINFNLAIDFTFTAFTTFLFYLLKFEYGVWKYDFVHIKGEFKDGKINVGTWNTKFLAVEAYNYLAKSDKYAVKQKSGAVDSNQTATKTDTIAAESGVKGTSVEVAQKIVT